MAFPASEGTGSGEAPLGGGRPERAGVHPIAPRPPLTVLWSTEVGLTTFRTTMLAVDGRIVLGTHGASLDGVNEPSDGVYVIDARSGRVERILRDPGFGDVDIGGVAFARGVVYFTSAPGLLVATSLDGRLRWQAALGARVRPAPALGDFGGDGGLDLVVGDALGRLIAFDAQTGAKLWERRVGRNAYGNTGFVGAAAVADLDGDGADDVVAGARDGVLRAYRGMDGKTLWEVAGKSGIHASPSLGDFDGDGRLEVLAAWSYGRVALFDAESGAPRWSQTLERDRGGIEGLFGSPIPLPGRPAAATPEHVPPVPGLLVEGTSWWGGPDGIVAAGPRRRAFKSTEGRVSATAVVTDLDGDGLPEAILGTEAGDLVAIRADGGRLLLAHLAGGIEATALLTDVDGDGAQELLVASNDGLLTCFRTGSTATPLLSRFRGEDPRNRGSLGGAILPWASVLRPAARRPGPTR